MCLKHDKSERACGFLLLNECNTFVYCCKKCPSEFDYSMELEVHILSEHPNREIHMENVFVSDGIAADDVGLTAIEIWPPIIKVEQCDENGEESHDLDSTMIDIGPTLVGQCESSVDESVELNHEEEKEDPNQKKDSNHKEKQENNTRPRRSKKTRLNSDKSLTPEKKVSSTNTRRSALMKSKKKEIESDRTSQVRSGKAVPKSVPTKNRNHRVNGNGQRRANENEQSKASGNGQRRANENGQSKASGNGQRRANENGQSKASGNGQRRTSGSRYQGKLRGQNIENEPLNKNVGDEEDEQEEKEKEFKCSQCNHSYAAKRNLRKHERLKHARVVNKYTCPLCGVVCSESGSLRQHFKHTHGNDVTQDTKIWAKSVPNTFKTVEKPKVKRKKMKCTCGAVCSGTFNFHRHVRAMHGHTNWKKNLVE